MRDRWLDDACVCVMCMRRVCIQYFIGMGDYGAKPLLMSRLFDVYKHTYVWTLDTHKHTHIVLDGLAKNRPADSVHTNTRKSACVVCELTFKLLIVWINNGPEANSRIKHLNVFAMCTYNSEWPSAATYWINDCGKSISLHFSFFVRLCMPVPVHYAEAKIFKISEVFMVSLISSHERHQSNYRFWFIGLMWGCSIIRSTGILRSF